MPIIAKAASGNADFPLPSSGPVQAVCYHVADMGLKYNKTHSKLEHKIRIFWEINELMQDGRRFALSSEYTLSLSDRAILRQHLISWRGRDFTEAELDGFDVEKLVGANCTINVIHKPYQGKTYANVGGIMPATKGVPLLTPTNPPEAPEWITKLRARYAEEAAPYLEAQDAEPVVVTDDASIEDPPF